jgi:hypothetical protein
VRNICSSGGSNQEEQQQWNILWRRAVGMEEVVRKSSRYSGSSLEEKKK